MNSLTDLADMCERSTGPDRMIDFWIHLRLNPIKDSDEAVMLDIDKVGIEGMHNPIAYTASLDAAVSVVPEHWFWRVGYTTMFCGWASVHETHPDHGEDGKNEFFSNCEHWKPIKIPPVNCLLACALRARASDAYRRQLKRARQESAR